MSGPTSPAPGVEAQSPTLTMVIVGVLVLALAPVTLSCVYLLWIEPGNTPAPFVAVMLGCILAGGGLAFFIADRLVLRAMRDLDAVSRGGAQAVRGRQSPDGLFRTRELARVETALRVLAITAAEQEAALDRAGVQKDTLLREVHHRVKNSMQIVTSLLSLHASRIEDSAAAHAFSAAHARINALAAIHREIYAAENLDSIGLAGFLTKLFGLSVPGAGRSLVRSTLDEGAGDETIPPAMAVPLGMLVMELVSMGSRGDRSTSRRTHVSCHRADAAALALTITFEGFQLRWETPAGMRSDLGQMLASAYVQQLHATLAVDATPTGSTLALRIPLVRNPLSGPRGSVASP